MVLMTLISLFGYGQLSYENKSLTIVQSFPYQTSYDIIIEELTKSKIDVEKRQNKDKTLSLSFKIGEDLISICYTKEKKFIYARLYTCEPYFKPADYQTIDKVLKSHYFLMKKKLIS